MTLRTKKEHKLVSGLLGLAECSCGFQPKRRAYLYRHLAKYDPAGWERRINDSEKLLREHVGGGK